MRGALLLLAAVVLATAATARETTYVYPPPRHTLGFERVGTWELKLFLGMGAAYANPQGLAAVKLKAQDDPDDRKDDVFLTLFGVNSGLGEIVYNPTRFEVSRYGRKGSGEERFLDPLGIAANEDGQVAVADTGNRRLVFLRMAGSGLEWAGVTEPEAEDFCPVDVDWSGGAFWAVDASRGRILRFGPEGDLLGEWTLANGQTLDEPRGICVMDPKDEWVRSRSFALLVVDRAGQRLRLFDKKGREIGTRLLDELIAPPGQFIYPVGDLHGQFVVVDSVSGCLVKLDPHLNLLDVLETVDEDPRPLRHPRGMALWRRFGQLFVAEEEGGAYLWTGTDLQDLRLTRSDRGGREAILLEYFLTEPSLVSVAALVEGREIEVSGERRRGRGQRRQWLPINEEVARAEALILRARATYSSKKILTVSRRISLKEEGR